MIPYTYCIRKDIVFDEDGNKHTVYGIEAINSNGKILVSLPDVFFDKQKALVCYDDNFHNSY